MVEHGSAKQQQKKLFKCNRTTHTYEHSNQAQLVNKTHSVEILIKNLGDSFTNDTQKITLNKFQFLDDDTQQW